MNCGYGNCVAIDHVGLCKCYTGFSLNGDACVDVNECLENPCHATAMYVYVCIGLYRYRITNYYISNVLFFPAVQTPKALSRVLVRADLLEIHSSWVANHLVTALQIQIVLLRHRVWTTLVAIHAMHLMPAGIMPNVEYEIIFLFASAQDRLREIHM